MPRKITRRCLITGFDPFDSHDFNPSQWVVNELPDEIFTANSGLKVELTKLTLSTCCTSSWRRIQAALNKNDFDMLLLLGQANGRTHLCLERFALNIRDYRIEDNNGHFWRNKKIEQAGPEAVRTYRDLDNLERFLSRKGLPADVSNYAGAFICNEVYYKSLRYQQEHPALDTVLFVHLPNANDYKRTLAKQPKKRGITTVQSTKGFALERMAEAVAQIAEFCAENPT